MKKNKKKKVIIAFIAIVLIVAVIGVSATISFSSIDSDTSQIELRNKYLEIQRAANLYLDLHNSDLNWFIINKQIDIKISDLKSENYITSDLSNPVTGDDISEAYFVRLYIAKDSNNNDYINSCIIDRSSSNIVCIADSYGNSGSGVTCCE